MKIKKILAGIIGIALILFLLVFVNAWVGNPVSNSLAKKAANEYIGINYKDLDLQIESANYSFKVGAYIIFVKSKKSEDTAFGIYVNSYGNVIKDNYEHEVANNFTTWRRLDAEMQVLANEIIVGKLDYDFDYSSFSFIEDADHLSKLELDMKLDIHNPPLPLTVSANLFSEDVSYSKVAEVAKEIESILKEQNIFIQEYNIRIIPLANKPKTENQAGPGSWANAISISNFPAGRMSEENLAQVMEKFEEERIAEVNAKDKK